LDRLTGKTKQAEEVPQGVTETIAVLQEQQQLDERKLDYIRLSDGTKPKPPSSVSLNYLFEPLQAINWIVFASL